MKTNSHRPLVLIILDGFGHSEKKEHNAIMHAHTPCLDALWKHAPHTLISGSGHGVGLPETQMGNSEVGHLNLGAGRIVYQEFTRINQSIKTGDFFDNTTLKNAMTAAKEKNRTVHLMGLLSSGGVHSHLDHFLATIELAQQLNLKQVYCHAFLDGRDTPPRSANTAIQQLEEKCKTTGLGQLASICGRYYAMDRDQRWERIQATYDLLTTAKSEYTAVTAQDALQAAYSRGETDEFVKPTLIGTPHTIEDGDVVIFLNFRADRARQLTRPFIEPNFNEFTRAAIRSLSDFICLTQYDAHFSASVAFPPVNLTNTLGAYLASQQLKQLRIAETEKYAHVTFFFNGGIEPPFPGEDRQLIPSPKVATYDLKPEMSAPELTRTLINAIESKKYDCIICNYANADMVGHSGNFSATVKAVECLDQCLSQVLDTLKSAGGEAMITADHGNADCMFDSHAQQARTAHTTNPVPFIYVGRPAAKTTDEGKLADVAPTMLTVMGLPIPEEMTGKTLLKLND